MGDHIEDSTNFVHAHTLITCTVLVQVGGGPTGVEVAAEIHDLVTEDMSHYFPTLKVPMHALSPVYPLNWAAALIGCS